ncbi:MAG: glycosyltransferase [Saprospiraceae bacterium]
MGLFIILFFALIHVLYWFFYFKRVSLYKEDVGVISHDFPPVSVVICFKSLDKYVEQTITSIVQQNYAVFEVILVNDFATEEDFKRVENILKKLNFPFIKIIHADKDLPGKKHALLQGVMAAKHDYILLTDIDCLASSQNWILKMMTVFLKENRDVVLGYGPMTKKNNLVSWFSGFETVMTALQYFGYHLAGKTYMGVGRNWAVRREVFLTYFDKAKGKKMASGDDDLLLQSMVGHTSIGICLDKDSFMYSTPKDTLKTFLRQKTRHVSTSVFYPMVTAVKLFIFSFSISGYYLLAFLLPIIGLLSWQIVLSISIIKWGIQGYLQTSAFSKLQAQNYTHYYPIAETLLAIYYPILALYSVFTKDKW